MNKIKNLSCVTWDSFLRIVECRVAYVFCVVERVFACRIAFCCLCCVLLRVVLCGLRFVPSDAMRSAVRIVL